METWNERKLNPANLKDRNEIQTGYNNKELATGKVKEITHLYAPPLGYGEIFIEHPENLEGYTPGEPYTPNDEHEGTVGAVGKTLFGKNSAVACGATLHLGRSSQDTARFEDAHIRDGAECDFVFDNATVKGGTHGRLSMHGNSSIEGNIYSANVTLNDSARIKGTGAVISACLDGDAEIDFTNGTPIFDERGDPDNCYATDGTDMRLRITQPTQYLDTNLYRSLYGHKVKNEKPLWGFRRYSPVYVSDTVRAKIEGLTLLDSLHTAVISLYEMPEAVANVRLCLSATQHKKNAECCQCMLWYPLYLLAEPVALHYFARVDGLVGKARGALASAGLDNPLAGLTIRNLETAMRARIKQVYEEVVDEDKLLYDSWNQRSVLKVLESNMLGLEPYSEEAEQVYNTLLCSTDGKTVWDEDDYSLMYWYLNYLWQIHGITPGEFLVDGVPREDILLMTALERGIPIEYAMAGCG